MSLDGELVYVCFVFVDDVGDFVVFVVEYVV